MNSDSYSYDNVRFPSLQFGRSAMASREFDEPSLEQLVEDINAGEGPMVEYKEWIPPTGDKDKWRELLNTVVGFANAKGGRLYIGVNDRGDIVGLEAPMRKLYGSKHRDDSKAQRDEYAWEIKQSISKGVQPFIEPALEWIEPAGHHVLCIAVQAGTERPYCVVETNDIFIRKGATTRKAHPHDLERIYAQRRARRRSPSDF
jgi:predicted HTH transcriptional regulator